MLEFTVSQNVPRLWSVVSTDVILAHCTEAKVTHLGEHGDLLGRRHVDPGAGSGDSDIGSAWRVGRSIGVRASSVPGFTGERVTCNRLPCAPEHLLTGTVGLRTLIDVSVQLEGLYTSGVFTDDPNSKAIVSSCQRDQINGNTVRT